MITKKKRDREREREKGQRRKVLTFRPNVTSHATAKNSNRPLNLDSTASRGVCQVFKPLIGSRSGRLDLHNVKQFSGSAEEAGTWGADIWPLVRFSCRGKPPVPRRRPQWKCFSSRVPQSSKSQRTQKSPNWLEFTISISRNDNLEIASFEIGHASPREEAPSVNTTAVSKQFTVPLRVSAGFFPCLARSRWGLQGERRCDLNRFSIVDAGDTFLSR